MNRRQPGTGWNVLEDSSPRHFRLVTTWAVATRTAQRYLYDVRFGICCLDVKNLAVWVKVIGVFF